ncbi:hypothetical protein AMJ39_02955 [candidate division TA06 bacterium DG_24]|uniref:(P)ppGpp synthetase n=1 Tax=candidate division TA06 bacterium DG_24 TaxID=1703770 RepID=A0A0S7WUM3_UNCT6|nr:MAG: hypothetical protein AMJ39_02955 [candidate division TA06 bacterium DG_24]
MQSVSAVEEILSEHPRLDGALVERAYRFSEQAHRGQLRRSGDEFVIHVLEVARILADLNMDSVTVAAGLLHDVVEDTETSVAEIGQEFGEEIARLVEMVTRVASLRVATREEQQMEDFRRMFLSMAEDIRVVLIKFADRLHNMRTALYLEPERAVEVATETLDVYAPLAHRLGISRVEWELEDLALKVLDHEAYEEVAQKLGETRREREAYIASVREPLLDSLQEAGIAATITGRPKHIFSVWRKMRTRGKPFEEIYDLFAIRVIVETIRDCYHTLGIVHSLWLPVPERIKDYIATPKSNMYQALHTTVAGPGGRLVEIQIRTKAMQERADVGIAAHWQYKEPGRRREGVLEQFAWLKGTIDWLQDQIDSREFMEMLKIDLFRDEVFCFTPKGDLKRLPLGATPIDFAFAVHTDVGFGCIGAKVNGKMMPLSAELKSGDTVEIITAPAVRASRDWLGIVRTSKARSKLRAHFRELEAEEHSRRGRALLEEEAERLGHRLQMKDLRQAAAELEYAAVDQLLADVGSGVLSPGRVLRQLGVMPRAPEPRLLIGDHLPGEAAVAGVKVDGISGVVIHLARCCQPVPGDDIIGYITRGRGISVHRRGCPRSKNLPDRRVVRAAWEGDERLRFLVLLELVATDRANLLAEVSKVVTEQGTPLRGIDLRSEGGLVRGSLQVEVRDRWQLERTLSNIGSIEGVIRLDRRRGEAGRTEQRVKRKDAAN